MVLRMKTWYEQLVDVVMNDPAVIEFMNAGNVVEVNETDDYFSIFSYPPQEAPIWSEAIGGGYTWIITKECPSPDHWVFTVYKLEHCDYDDYDYDEDNRLDCRNCPNFHLMNGNWYYCNKANRDMMDPLMEECYGENAKKDVI